MREERYFVDGQNRISRVDRTDATTNAVSRTHYTYNDRGDVTSITDPVGLTTRYARNLLGWPVTMTTPDARTWLYEYDDRGNISKLTEPNGTIVGFTYDSLGRQTTVASTAVAPGIRAINDNFVWCTASTQIGNLCREYSDPYAGVHTYEYTPEGSISSHEVLVRGLLSVKVSLSYDIGARLRSVTYPDSTTVTYDYNADGSIARVSVPTKELARFLYDDNGNPSVVTNDYGLDESYSYDSRGRLRSLRSTNILANLPGDLLDDQFDWTGNGQLSRLTRFGLSTAAIPRPTPEVWDVTHDGFGQLQSVSVNAQEIGRYRYDLSGKVTEFSERNEPIRSSTYVLDQLRARTAGNLQKTWTYDTNGQVISDEVSMPDAPTRTRSYAWDALGRIATVNANGASTEYKYTPRGALGFVRMPTQFDTDDTWYVGDFYSRSLAGTTKKRILVGSKVIGELSADGTFEMAHRTYDGTVLATSKCSSAGHTTITRQEEFTPYGAHLAGTVTPAGAGFVEHFQGLRKDEVTVANGRAYDDEDGLWLTRDKLPQANPSRVIDEPRLATMYSFNFGDPMRFRDGNGQNPVIAGVIGATGEALRQYIQDDHMDWGRVGMVGLASAASYGVGGYVGAIGGEVNAIAGSMLAGSTFGAIMRAYDGVPFSAQGVLGDMTIGAAVHVGVGRVIGGAPAQESPTVPTPTTTTTITTTSPLAITVEAPSSRILGRNLEGAGFARPPNSAAHHIVAGSAPLAAPSRSILQRLGIGINDQANGVFLPANRSSPNPTGAAVHQPLHTGAYYTAVNQMLGAATTREEAIGILGSIRNSLLSGGL